MFLFIFFISPARTFPGPISYIFVTPFSASLFIVSTHFTGPKVCLYNSSFISSAEVKILAVVFATRETSASFHA